MAISSLTVAVRTTGAAQLAAMGARFTALGRRASAAARAMHAAASPRIAAGLTRIGVAARFAAAQFARLARSAADSATGFAKGLAPLAGKFAGVLALLVPLVPVVTHLSGGILLLAPAAFTAATALGTLKLALSGVGDAITAGLSGDAEQFNDALKKLSPSAQEFARSAVQIVKAWRPVKTAIQEAFFGGGKSGNNLAHEIRQMSISFKPLVEKWLPQVARLFGGLVKSASDFLTLPSTKNDLEGIFRNTLRGLDAIVGTIKALGRALLDITAVAAPAFANFAESIEDGANKFADWIKESRNAGKITQWIENAKRTAGLLLDIGKEIVNVFKAIFTAGEGSEKPFLEGLRDTIGKLAEWFRSGDGQGFLKGLGSFAVAIADIGTKISEWKQDFEDFREWLRSLFGQGENAIGMLGRLATAGATAFSWVGGAAAAVRNLATAVQNAMGSIQAAINSVRGRVVFLDVITRHSEQGFARALGNSGGTGGGRMQVRAAGGPVWAGMGPVLVGERGPEIVTFGRSGYVHNARQSAAMASGGATAVELVVAPGADSLFAAMIQKAVRGGLLKLRVTAAGAVTA